MMRTIVVKLIKALVSKLKTFPPWLRPELSHLRHSGLLGPASAMSTLLNENVIAAILYAHQRSWRNGETPNPSQKLIFGADHSSQSAIIEQRPLRLSIVMQRYWAHNGMESDLWVHYSGSAAHAGHSVSQFDLSNISYDDNTKRPMNYGKKLKDGVEALKEFLLLEKPDIVVFDGNFIPRGKSIDCDMIRKMKIDLGFKLCTVIGDLHDLQPENRLDYWGEVSDLVVVFNSETRHYIDFVKKEKLLVAGWIPFDERRFHGSVVRDIGLGFCGGKGRRRDAFLSFAEQCGVPTTAHFVDDKKYLTGDKFRDFLSRSRITFANGFVGTVAGIPISVMTGRIAESILSGSLLVYESGSQIDNYLVPFVHYIPVDNIHELVHFCRFLLDNDEVRAEITNSAHEYLIENYSSKKFWDCVTQRLCNVVAP